MSLFERPDSLHQIAARRLKDAIISGQFPLGQPLSENLLASQFGISKTPVREALRELSLGGLVTVRPQSGTYVFTLSEDDVVDLCYLRETLELSALKLSLRRAPDALADDLSDIVGRMKEAQSAQDRPAYLKLDGEFHGLFFRLADNAYLSQAYEPIADRIAALRTRLSARGFMTECLVEHDAIAELARQRHGDAMVAKLQAHIGRVCDHYAREIAGTVSSERATIPRRRRKSRSAKGSS